MKQLEYWNEFSGAAWVDNAAAMETINGPAGAGAFELAAAAPGETVVDAGCGTGATTFALARSVGPTGRVTGIDLSRPMIHEARRQRDALELSWVDFVEDAVEDAPLQASSVDLVFSRMCLMLVDDAPAALANLGRALRPGGRLVATAFRDATENEWLPLVVLGSVAYVGDLPPLPLPGEPSPFRFGDPDVPRRLLEEAGFVDIEISPVDTEVTLDGDAESAADLLIQLGPAGGPYRSSTPANQQLARTSVAGLLAKYVDEHDRLTLPSATWTISARRPA